MFYLYQFTSYEKKRLRHTWRQVKSRDVKESIVEALSQPDCQYDERRKEATLGLANVSNFETIGAGYHIKCYNEICNPLDCHNHLVGLTDKIALIVQYIKDHEHTQFTLSELVEQLPDDVYKPSERTILSRLKSYYGDQKLVVVGKKIFHSNLHFH